MAVKIGMNGFGRIGRYLTRLLMDDAELELTAVNARSDSETYAHLLKYDSVFGRFSGEVSSYDNGLTINGRHIALTRWNSPAASAWKEQGCDLVVETTGKFKDRESCQGHLEGGAKKVVISAPGKGVDVSICPNVNDQAYDPAKHHIISCGSCTTNCLAPVSKVLNDAFGISHGYATTIHSYTMTQRILDGSHKDLRRARAASMSQIPTTTGATKAVGEILPELQGRLDGMAIRVPTPCGSLIDLVCELQSRVDPEQVNNAFREASNETLGYTDEPLVSVDFLGDSHGAVVDCLSTKVLNGSMVKVLAWYDNEAGFTHQLLRLLRRVAREL
ncbi:MAG: type I glyceraldehyde-3-phosphate dehydrogenase [Desulfohalobiaceae bacterium]|nr:type I glyceraldehyde-3-phosphate dehydrogenase [Desulfohalobiaceae bacterium]